MPRRELSSLDPRLAEAYRDTDRKLSRDLNAVEEMRLLERHPRGWRAPTEIILGFRPLRREPEPERAADDTTVPVTPDGQHR